DTAAPRPANTLRVADETLVKSGGSTIGENCTGTSEALVQSSTCTRTAVLIAVRRGAVADDRPPPPGVPTAAVALAHDSPDVDPTARAVLMSRLMNPVLSLAER